jgi:ribulose-phosphate 3-epimerase
MEIYPSFMCADLLNLEKAISTLDAHCDGYHIDVMDDHFVPNLTMGPDFVNAIVHATTKPVQVHLMVDHPKSWVDRLTLRENDTFVFHYEVFECHKPIKDLIESVKAKGWKVGVAFNPQTDWALIKSDLLNLDKVLVMSVNPGFAGQKFIPSIIEKIKKIVVYKKTQNANFNIYVDGGIGKDNIKEIAGLGVDAVVVGAAIFAEKNPLHALKELYEIAKPT